MYNGDKDLGELPTQGRVIAISGKHARVHTTSVHVPIRTDRRKLIPPPIVYHRKEAADRDKIC